MSARRARQVARREPPGAGRQAGYSHPARRRSRLPPPARYPAHWPAQAKRPASMGGITRATVTPPQRQAPLQAPTNFATPCSTPKPTARLSGHSRESRPPWRRHPEATSVAKNTQARSQSEANRSESDRARSLSRHPMTSQNGKATLPWAQDNGSPAATLSGQETQTRSARLASEPPPLTDGACHNEPPPFPEFLAILAAFYARLREHRQGGASATWGNAGSPRQDDIHEASRQRKARLNWPETRVWPATEGHTGKQPDRSQGTTQPTATGAFRRRNPDRPRRSAAPGPPSSSASHTGPTYSAAQGHRRRRPQAERPLPGAATQPPAKARQPTAAGGHPPAQPPAASRYSTRAQT